jgi:undecaprenyl diphosphate synthase
MQIDKLPLHVAIIMDGNGRWATLRGMSRTQGHLEGVKRVEEIIKTAHDTGIKYLTIYAFSTENWTRPADEVSMIVRTFIMVLGQKARDLAHNGIRVNFIGRRQGMPTEAHQAMTLNIAFNYGSRGEIIDAVKSIATKVTQGQIKPNDIDEKTISSHLYTKDQPDPDLLIRTSGEERISNFLLWQLSYAELYFTEKFWPEFTPQEFAKALSIYAQRDRRWGGVKV